MAMMPMRGGMPSPEILSLMQQGMAASRANQTLMPPPAPSAPMPMAQPMAGAAPAAPAAGMLGQPMGAAAQPKGLLAGLESGLGSNSMALLMAGLGTLSGRDRASQFAGMMQGLQAGYSADAARKKEAKEAEEKKKNEDRETAFAESISTYLKSPEMAAAIRADPRKATEMLRLWVDQRRDERAQAQSDRMFGLERERLDIAKSKGDIAEVGGALVERQPDGTWKPVFQGGGTSTLATQAAAREAEAKRLGISPDDPGFKSFVLTGKMPREDAQPLTATDKKAILEADEMVAANEAAITALREARKLSGTAYDGVTAGTRAAIGNTLPDWMVPNFIADPDSAAATSNFDNAVVGQALTQLKTIFGGAPTEGERKILLELQGSANQPRKVREEILDRAARAAEARLKFNRDRANALRGGDYYKNPNGAAGAGGAAAPAAPTVDPLGIR